MENLCAEDTRRQKIKRHISKIPKIYRPAYEKAVTGKSKSAAIKAFCLECCMWKKTEITECTSLACPLYAVRPYARKSKTPKGEGFSAQEQTQSPEAVSVQV